MKVMGDSIKKNDIRNESKMNDNENWSFDWTDILTPSIDFSFFELQFANCNRLECNDDIYIFDEVGTGKTISSGLMALHYIYNKYNWEKECEYILGHKRLINDKKRVVKGKEVDTDVLVITVNAVTNQFKKDWSETLNFNEEIIKSEVGKKIFKDFSLNIKNGEIEIAVINGAKGLIEQKNIDKEIDQYYQNMDGYLNKMAILNEEIDEFKRRKLISLTRKDFWKRKIEARSETHDYYDDSLGDAVERINMYENIKRIYKANTDIINTAVNEEISSRPIKKEIARLQCVADDLARQLRDYGFNEEILEQVFEEKIQNGEITETQLQKIYLLLDKVEIKGRRGEYHFESYRPSNPLVCIVSWFIKNVYELDPGFVNRNIDLLEEEEGVSRKLTKKEEN